MNYIKRTFVLCLLLSFLFQFESHAQKSQLASYYAGGEEQFWTHFQQHFNFPSSSMKSQLYGTTLIKLTLNSDGVPARILFLNQIDIDIIKSITRSFTKMSHNWSSFPDDSELFVSIRFSYNSDYLEQMEIDKSHLVKEFAEFSYVVETNDGNSINYKKNYSHLVKAAKKAFKHSEYQTAKQIYSKLIAIDPYQLEYYKRRIEIEAFMGSKIFACTDIKVMKDLLNYKGSVPLHGCN